MRYPETPLQAAVYYNTLLVVANAVAAIYAHERGGYVPLAFTLAWSLWYIWEEVVQPWLTRFEPKSSEERWDQQLQKAFDGDLDKRFRSVQAMNEQLQKRIEQLERKE